MILIGVRRFCSNFPEESCAITVWLQLRVPPGPPNPFTRATRWALFACPPLRIRHCSSHILQCLGKILDQIVGVLEPGGEADKAFADAELGARFRRQALMRRGRGMGDEALGVAEIVRDLRDLQRVEAAEGARLAAFHLEPDQRRRSEEHTSELQSRGHLVCRLLLEKKK